MGELDWAALSPITHKEYRAILEVFSLSHSGDVAIMFGDNPIKTRAEVIARKIGEWIDRKSIKDDGTEDLTKREVMLNLVENQLSIFLNKLADSQTLLLVATVLQELAKE